MSFNHKEIVMLFSKIVATVINWILMIIGIIALGLIIYGFYIFIVKQYSPGTEPGKNWGKYNPKNSTYLFPSEFKYKKIIA